MKRVVRLVGILAAFGASLTALCARAEERPPHVLLITVDTLRADRLGSYGYSRDTSPNLDRLLAAGVRFEQARTVEPLTAPGLSSMLTSLYPHEHGATRNGVRMREGLPSLTKVLRRRGYLSAAFVGNWTLNDKISGLAEHFEHYETVLEQRRWLLWAREANAVDLNDAALTWIREQRSSNPRQRLAIWVHYVEPHGPYEFHDEFVGQLGLGSRPSKKDRYDTEVAFVDARIGELLAEVDELFGAEPVMTVFASDHGESLGEHGYWGHGRHCFEPGLRIPMGITWPGVLPPTVVEAPALIIDIPQTVLGLLDLPRVASFQGLDWTPVLKQGEAEPLDRTTMYQSHRGAVHGRDDEERVRQRGLLEVAVIADGRKEILRIGNGRRWLYDLRQDPTEVDNQATKRGAVSAELSDWLEIVQAGLVASDDLPLPRLSEEEIEKLKALGYLD